MPAARTETTTSAHACTWPGCAKSYARADHLERHQRIHSGRLDFQCHQCDKAYARSDVLNRHLLQFHGESGSSVGKPRRSACQECVSEHLACDGAAPRPCSRCISKGKECRYTHWDSENGRASESSDRSTTRLTNEPWSGFQPDFVPPVAPSWVNLDANTISNVNDGVHPAHVPQWHTGHDTHVVPMGISDVQHISMMDLSPTSWLINDLLQSATSNASLPLITPDPCGINSTTFDWGFPDLGGNIFEPIATRPSSPAPPLNQRPEDPELVVAVSAEEVDGRPNAKELPDGRPPETPWTGDHPSTTSDDAQILLPPKGNQTNRTELLLPETAGINPSALKIMQVLILRSHQAVWPTPDLGNFPSAQDLTTCVKLYLANFASWLPIIDSPRGTFRIDKAAPIVLKAVAAVGSVYSRNGLRELGVPLAELVRRDVLFISEHDDRLVSEMAVVQATLLHSVFATFSGVPKLLQRAEMERTGLVASCKRVHLLDSSVSAVKQVVSRGLGEEERSRALKQDHRRRRLGWAIFLLDAQLACLFGVHPQMPLEDIQSPLPTAYPDDSVEPVMFQSLLSSLLEHGRLPGFLDDVGYSCLAYALYRVCIDLAATQTFSIPGEAWCPYPRQPLVLLEQLSRFTLDNQLDPTGLSVSCTALAYHAKLRFTSPGLLEAIKQSAGKSGSAPEVRAAQDGVRGWVTANPRGTREIFAYAAMLKCLGVRHTFDTPTELIWTFDATLCLWACLKFGSIAELAGLSSSHSVNITWAWSAVVEEWIHNGSGAVIIQGVGAVRDVSASDMLRSSANSLDLMSWGLAERYKAVLLTLIRAEAQP